MATNRLIRVLVVPVGEEATVRALPATPARLQAHLQEIVGGPAKAHSLGADADGVLDVWVNGARTAVWLPKNRRLPEGATEESDRFVRGTLVLARRDDAGQPKDLTELDIRHYAALWDYPMTVAEAEERDNNAAVRTARWSAPNHTRVLVAELGHPPRVCRLPLDQDGIAHGIRRLLDGPIAAPWLMEEDGDGTHVEALFCALARERGMPKNQRVWREFGKIPPRTRTLRGTIVVLRRDESGEVIDVGDDIIELYGIIWGAEPRLADLKPVVKLVKAPSGPEIATELRSTEQPDANVDGEARPTMRALVIRRGQEPEVYRLPSEQVPFIESVQRIVRAVFDGHALVEDSDGGAVVAYAHNIGAEMGRPPNRWIGDRFLHGTMVVCRRDAAGILVDLSEADVAEYTTRFALGTETDARSGSHPLDSASPPDDQA